MNLRGTTFLFVLTASGGASGAVAEMMADGQEDLASLDLETLMQMDVEVTTASKGAQSLYSVAAPIHVISADEIRRAGATSIPDAIRLAPGVVVQQIDPGKWVVGVRGFAWQYANKALILLDGRPVYTPLNSSVYWNMLDVPMEQIERIEVIRGPGDARWGSHAVNGIINIITRQAVDDKGTALSGIVDSNAGSELTARHGGALGSHMDYRAYAKYLEQGDFESASGFPRLGDRAAWRAGLRLDGRGRGTDRFSLIGDVQQGRDTSSVAGQGFAPVRYDTEEWSIVGRWERGEPGRVNQQLQLSLDTMNQELYEKRETLDFSYQAMLPEMRAQTWTFGVTYKNSQDDLSSEIAIEPRRMTQDTYGVFVHNSVALSAHNRLQLGSQLEHNQFTGWEVQPNLQYIYSPTERLSYWASVSRAVRTPLRTENGFALDVPLNGTDVGRITGDRDLRAEKVLAWQAGVRMGWREDLFVDVAAFYNEYRDLIIQVAGTPFFESTPAPGRTVFPAVYANSADGHTMGLEAALKAQPLARWNVGASVSVYSQTHWVDSLGFGSVSGIDHQFQLHSAATVATNLQWNVDLYYAGELSTGDVPSYYKLDTEISWTPLKGLAVGLGLKNALDASHQEAGSNTVDAVMLVPRTAYLRLYREF